MHKANKFLSEILNDATSWEMLKQELDNMVWE
jgi:hypothetical protein